MNSVIYAGMDVHKESVSLGMITETGEIVMEKRVSSDYSKIKKELLKIREARDCQIACCYEAGPTGYGLAREINSSKIASCKIVAPGKLPKKPGDRIKTDRRDALKLARLMALKDISEVAIPDKTDESARELLRYRKVRKEAQKRAKKQLKSLLLRQGKQYEGASNWSKKYVAWVARIDFGEESLGQVRNGYLDTIENLGSEVKDLDKRLELIAGKPRYASRMEKLRLFRGIGVLTGMALLLEVGDFNRFATAKSFMAWVGLVPSEKSSGNTKKQGNITKAGNGYLRTLLVEAAWHYAFKGKFKDPRIGVGSTLGQEYVEYAHRADRRLQNKLYQLYYWKKRPKNIATTAVARELAGFIWGMMTEQVALRKA